MYILGALLLIAGCLLCITIAWAAAGFFAMGSGLICLLVAEEGWRASRLPESAMARLIDLNSSRATPQTLSSPFLLSREGDEYEQRWKWLLESDADLASVAKILERFGPCYVGQLARVYTVFERKDFLPVILKMIVSAASHNGGASEAAESPTQEGSRDGLGSEARTPNVDPPPPAYGSRAQECGEDDTTTLSGLAQPHQNDGPEVGLDDLDSLKQLFNKLASFEDSEKSLIGQRRPAGAKSSILRD